MVDVTLEKTLTVLVEARRVISDEKRWTRGMFIWRAASDDDAPFKEAKFCAYGAISEALYGHDIVTGRWLGRDDGDEPIDKTRVFQVGAARTWLQRAAQELYGRDAMVVNDVFGYEAIMLTFDRAIVLVEKAGAGDLCR